MPEKIGNRLLSQGLIWTEGTPESDEQHDVQGGDLITDEVNEDVYLINADGDKIRVNEWDQVRNKPVTMPPDRHHVASVAHYGRMHIDDWIDGFDLDHPVIQSAMAAGLLVSL